MYARSASGDHLTAVTLTGKTGRFSASTRNALAIAVTCGALVLALAFIDVHALATAAQRLSPLSLIGVVLLLLAGALLASARLACVASDLGYPMRPIDAIAALSLGQLGGAIFLQVVGQVIARSAVLAGRGVPVAATVAVTGYERLLALAVSVVLALFGGWYLFGHITLDVNAGGATFLKLAVCGVLALIASAALGWWPPVAAFARANIGRRAAWRIARSLTLSVLIQACTMAAYMAAAAALAPEANMAHIAAASAVVMLAASVPISLAGWGVRELGAIYVLGAIGVDREIALLIAILIGAAALASVAVLAAAVALARTVPRAPVVAPAPPPQYDVPTIVAWSVPVLAAIAVFFQIHVPLASSRINVNLADPLVIVAAALFVIECVKSRRFPEWRLPMLNLHLLAITVLVVLAFLHGWATFGMTAWALTNRLVGWFVLLSYLATGALIVAHGGREGFMLLLRSFVGTALAVIAVDVAIYCVTRLGIQVPEEIFAWRLEGFAQNPNAFALQLILALIAAFVSIKPGRLQTAVVAVLFIGLWFSGSRSGFIAVALVLTTALVLRTVSLATLTKGAAVLIAAILLVDWLPEIVVATVRAGQMIVRFVADLFATSGVSGGGGVFVLKPPKFSAFESIAAGYDSSNVQRIASLKGALAMFQDHPIFGAGLGAFIESYTREHGVPLVIHSTPLWLLAEMGVVGLFVFTAPFVRVLKHEVYSAERGDTARAVLILALLAFGAIAVVHDIVYQRSFWIIFGAALACGAMRIKVRAPAPREEETTLAAIEHPTLARERIEPAASPAG